MKSAGKHISEDRFFDPDPAIRSLAGDLYQRGCRYADRQPAWTCRPASVFRSECNLWLARRSVHYPRSLCLSHVVLAGHPAGSSGRAAAAMAAPVEQDHRKIWQLFCENFHLFRGTPSGIWLTHELSESLAWMKSPTPPTRTDCLISFPRSLPRPIFLRANSSSVSTSKSFAPPTPPPIRSNIIKPSVKVAGTDVFFQPFVPMELSISMRPELAGEYR